MRRLRPLTPRILQPLLLHLLPLLPLLYRGFFSLRWGCLLHAGIPEDRKKRTVSDNRCPRAVSDTTARPMSHPVKA